MPYQAGKNEEEILAFWEKNAIFEKSVESRPENKPYVFYDGPPFATGLPHYGHIVVSLMKDVVPRYWTMKGRRVERVWGWDCHGLPIENIVEKELGTKTKKEIEQMGVAKFNEICRSKVLGYVEEWEKTIKRLGRWVDMKNAYRTMDRGYMESVWWVFKQLWDNGLVYEDYRSMHVCPRCETTLSQQEVSEGYKDVKDISVFVKFLIHLIPNSPNKIPNNTPTYILAWTTTPWTLPGNVALAVAKNVKYVLVEFCNHKRDSSGNVECFRAILAKEIFDKWSELGSDFRRSGGDEYFSGVLTGEGQDSGGFHPPRVIQEFNGSDLVGIEYGPLFPYYKDTKNAFRVVAGDFVTTTDGTGVVHIAPAFGEDDFKVGKRESIPLVQHVSMDGRMKPETGEFAGMEVKPRSDDDKVRLGTDIAIIRYLQEHGSFFAKQNVVHTYPHCWRCDTPLLNYATSSWFVKVTAVKEKAIKLAEKINWSPEHIKDGRFGMWLAGARDWSISRQRFWASVMPVWRCDDSVKGSAFSVKKCDNVVVFGSADELEKKSGKKIDDLHKHIVDEVIFPCEKCGGTMKRVPDVLDTWFDSGCMPYAQVHYPFENKKKFDDSFPAEFIAEAQDQTRAWFYYLHVLGTALFKKIAFKNVIVNGIVLAEDGKKMSKRLQNYPEPNTLLEKYGADALRYYLVSAPVMHAENLNFSEAGVRESFNKVVNTLWNVLEFYRGYVGQQTTVNRRRSTDDVLSTVVRSPSVNILDKWILTKLQMLVQEVTTQMDGYHLAEASRPIEEFINELSTWYVRRSRDRFKVEGEDKAAAMATLREVLFTLSKVMAPFTPFIAEKVYQAVSVQSLGASESVHLEEWPKVNKDLTNDRVIDDMDGVRKIVEMGHALRKEAGIPVRQVLSKLKVQNSKFKMTDELLKIVEDEMNVKEVFFGDASGEKWKVKEEGVLKVSLNIEITPELKKEGLLREVIRAINNMRKEQKMTAREEIVVEYATDDELLQCVFADFAGEIKKGVLAREVRKGAGDEIEIGGRHIQLRISH